MKLIDIVRECVKEGKIDKVNEQSILNFQRIHDERGLRLAEINVSNDEQGNYCAHCQNWEGKHDTDCKHR